MLFVLVISAVSAAELLNILNSLSPKLLKRALGYAVVLEIFFSVVLTALAATTGSITGMAIASCTGFVITLVLISAKKILGYQKLEKVNGKWSWVEYSGTASIDKVGSATGKILKGICKSAFSFVGSVVKA